MNYTYNIEYTYSMEYSIKYTYNIEYKYTIENTYSYRVYEIKFSSELYSELCRELNME